MEDSDEHSDAYYDAMIDDALAREDDETQEEEVAKDKVAEDNAEDEVAEDEVAKDNAEEDEVEQGVCDSDDEDSEAEGSTQSRYNVDEPERNFVDSDGEDPVERSEYDVAITVADYNDDRESVRHDEYYDSGEGSDDEQSRRMRGRNFTERHDGILFQGQKFFNRLALKEAVLWHALKNKRNIRQIRYDKKKVSFTCLGKGRNGVRCGWKLYASVRKGHTKWRIRSLGKRHSCQKSGVCKMLKVNAIARIFLDKIRDEPDYFKPQRIEKLIFERWGINVTINQAQAARVKVLKWLEKEYDDQFRRLRDYCNEIVNSNPGSSVEVDTIRSETGEDVFYRFYVCFSVLRDSWKQSCRPLIGIDGTFLKGKVPGMLLVALGRDGDNRIYPVAWGIVEKENTDNWAWFVKRIRVDLRLGDGSGYVIVSDRQKGLISAVSSELPGVEHRHCVRHIYGNLKAKFGKRDPMKKFIWDLAWSYNEAEFKARLQDIKNFDDEVYTYVVNSDPSSWCRAFYKLGPCCEDVENNSTESFNKSICKAREKPFVPMLEMIRTQAMTRIHKRNKKSQKHQGTLTPYATQVLAEEEDEAKECTVQASTGGMIQSTLGGCSHLVNLPNKTCSCRKWEIRGIPCVHAYGVILKKELEVYDYVATWFHSETWRRTYQVGITPLRGYKFWPHGTLPICYPPNTEKKGCEEKKRKRGKNESPQKSKRPMEEKREMHCKVCHRAGHNKRFHDKENHDQGAGHTGKGAEKKGKGAEKKGKGAEKKSKGAEKGKGVEKKSKGAEKGKGVEKKGKGTEKKSKGAEKGKGVEQNKERTSKKSEDQQKNKGSEKQKRSTSKKKGK